MSDKPRPRWFQIHLSTAIVLMFVAGALMWSNSVAYIPPVDYVEINQRKALGLIEEYGWPTIYYYNDTRANHLSLAIPSSFENRSLYTNEWHPTNLAIN